MFRRVTSSRLAIVGDLFVYDTHHITRLYAARDRKTEKKNSKERKKDRKKENEYVKRKGVDQFKSVCDIVVARDSNLPLLILMIADDGPCVYIDGNVMHIS